MKLGHTTEVFNPAEDHRWLGSKHATDTAKTVTLDASAFDGIDYGVEAGIIPSGIVLHRLASGLYGPSGGEPEGHLFTTINTHGYTVDSPAALMWHGSVIVANLPANHGLDDGTAVDQVNYVGDVPAAGG